MRGLALAALFVLSCTPQQAAPSPPITPTRTATAQPSPMVLGDRLGQVVVGSLAVEVLAALGPPTLRTVAHGLGTPQWEYGSTYVVMLGGSEARPGRVWKVTAYRDGIATTAGFAVGGTRDAFRRIYAGAELHEWPGDQLEARDATGRSVTAQFDARGRATWIVAGGSGP